MQLCDILGKLMQDQIFNDWIPCLLPLEYSMRTSSPRRSHMIPYEVVFGQQSRGILKLWKSNNEKGNSSDWHSMNAYSVSIRISNKSILSTGVLRHLTANFDSRHVPVAHFLLVLSNVRSDFGRGFSIDADRHKMRNITVFRRYTFYLLALVFSGSYICSEITERRKEKTIRQQFLLSGFPDHLLESEIISVFLFLA